MTRLFQLSLTVVFLLPLAATAEDQKNEVAEKAVDAAEAWLALVDQEKYGDAWESAATYLKNVVKKEDLTRALTGTRKPLGGLKTRTLKSKEYRTSLPGAPDGEYVIIQFETSFENKKSATETITPMLDRDGTWRVSGYLIK